MADCCECGNNISGSLTFWDFLAMLRSFWTRTLFHRLSTWLVAWVFGLWQDCCGRVMIAGYGTIMHLHRLLPMCKELLYSIFHRKSPGILMIGGFTLLENNWTMDITGFVQWLLHKLSYLHVTICLVIMKQRVTCIWQDLSYKIPLKLSGCHVKCSLLDVYNRVILSMKCSHWLMWVKWVLSPHEHLK